MVSYLSAQGRFLLAFSNSLEALRFCHAAQLALMYRRWPNEGHIHHGRTEYAPDGRLLFSGPRVAMAVHESSSFRSVLISCQLQCCCSIITMQLPLPLAGYGFPACKFACATAAQSGLCHASAHTTDQVLPAQKYITSKQLTVFVAGRVLQPRGVSKPVKWVGRAYEGDAVSFAQKLVQAAHGGQVVLSGTAWASVQDGLPGLSQVGRS